MSSLSGGYYMSLTGDAGFVPDKRPAKGMTPLYAEIVENVTTSKKGLSIESLTSMSKITSHTSRVRLALEELEARGAVASIGGVFVPVKAKGKLHEMPKLRKKRKVA